MSSFIINPYAFTAPLLLDTYAGAVGAYSMRKLTNAYGGPALRVRRSNDNAEQDIGFDSSNVLNESALTTFVGANSGYVTKWYDQSGSGKDMTQTTTGSQPRIVNAGTVDTKSSKPCIYFDGSNDFLASTLSSVTNFSIVGASHVTGTADANMIGIARSANFEIGVLSVTNWGIIVHPTLAAIVTTSTGAKQYNSTPLTATTDTSYLYHGNWTGSGSTVRYRRNGTDATASGATAANLRSGTGSPTYYSGYAFEFIVYNADKWESRSDIEAAVNGYYSFY